MIATFDIIRFNFTEPLHISNSRSDYARSEERIRSDTLLAAIMQSWAMLGREEWISDKPGFVTSSLCPFASSGNETIYFFPKPVKDQPGNKVSPDLLKKFKKVRYYEKGFFEERLEDLLEIKAENVADEFLTRVFKPGDSPLYRSSVIPRIMKPREGNSDTRIFYMERREFKPGAGLFFLVRFQTEESRSRLLTGLRLLADNGLGSDRTVGHGRFTFCEDRISLELPSGKDHMISLSLYLPGTRNELIEGLGPCSRYELVRRGGWISEPFNTLRKRNVYMFNEGSLLSFNENCDTVKGRVVDLKPLTLATHHAIYRSGESIFLPIKCS